MNREVITEREMVIDGEYVLRRSSGPKRIDASGFAPIGSIMLGQELVGEREGGLEP